VGELSWFVDFIRSQGTRAGSPSIMLGTVTASSPLQVKVGGIELDGGDLYVSEQLRQPGAVQVGDTVAVMPLSGGQTFIVLSKVVKPGG